jgi:hypothetical protein
MTGEMRRTLKVLVNEGVRHELESKGRNPLETKAAVEDDLEGRRFDRVPIQKGSKHGVFMAYIEYEGAPVDV